MSTNRFARPRAAARRQHEPEADLDFDPVVMRERADGWLPDRQIDFIKALAESGCVEEACARVGMSPRSAYTLRRRPDAHRFRVAWEAAVAHAIRRLSDAALGRALNGVARPVYFNGQQIGERRYYDERLTQFLLRYNDPVRYGRFRDGETAAQVEGGPAMLLNRALNDLGDEAYDRALGVPVNTPFGVQRTQEEEDDATVARLLAQVGHRPGGGKSANGQPARGQAARGNPSMGGSVRAP